MKRGLELMKESKRVELKERWSELESAARVASSFCFS